MIDRSSARDQAPAAERHALLSPEPELMYVEGESSNDNDGAQPPGHLAGPDAHGQAAMLLVESLIHGLIARSVISAADAIDIVGVAMEVKKEVAADLGDSPATLRKSLGLLQAIGASLSHDVGESPTID